MTIISENGRLHLVIHNASHMGFGSSEAFTPEQLAQLNDTNLLSTLRVNRAALTHFRKQRKGLVDWVSSSGTHGGTPPYLAPYFAANAAMDSLAGEAALASWPVGGSRHSTSFLVLSPREPITSRMPASQTTTNGLPNTTRLRIRD